MKRTIKKTSHPDFLLLTTVGLLLVLGIIVITSISVPLSQKKFEDPKIFLFRFIFFGMIPGIVLAVLTYKIPLKILKKYSFYFLLGNLFLMGLVFVPKVGISIGGAKRWINLGFFSFQPSELLKLTFIIYLSSWLQKRKNSMIKEKKDTSLTFLAFLVIISVIGIFLVLQPDVSTLGVIVLTGMSIYFVAKTPLRHTLIVTFLGILILALLIKVSSYRFNRILVLVNPDIDPLGLSYQIKQILIAIGSGGIFGKGLGMSTQKFGFVPQPLSDSIFAIFAEETGFVGSLIMIMLFLMFAWRGLKISKEVSDEFLKYLSLGITCWITLQAFVNIGAMVGILPLTGIPLPFISYGGSALTAELASVGILLNISRYGK